MIANKHITKIAGVIMAAAVFLCLFAIIFSDQLVDAAGGTGILMEYESKLFDTDSMISIDIIMDENDWNDMIANATAEEYYQCDAVINGTTFYSVGIRPKGNTSLTAIASDPDSDRYSFKLEFDHYVDGQTCWGLDKLILNNNYADATNMKEAIIYDMYQYLGADASLYNYASISVNGSYWGVYLALEAVEESFVVRNYGTENGELYKPDSMNMGGGGNFEFANGDPSNKDFPSDFDPSNMDGSDFNSFKSDAAGFAQSGSDSSDFSPPDVDFGGNISSPGGSSGDRNGLPDGVDGSMIPGGKPGGKPGEFDFDSSSPGGRGGGFSMGGSGSDLNYTDDDLDSYSTIWDGEVTKTSRSDHRRVVEALKNISEGNDLETYMDVDNVLKYLAVHTFSVNLDSLTGSMTHNYYLYEKDGQLNIIPWDYNLAFGAMDMGTSGDASSMINFPIDTPFSSTISLSDRQFFAALLEQEEYLERYHEYYRQLVEEYIDGGVFEETYSRIRGQIDTLVESDPTAFYTYEEYDAAARMLYDTVLLRAESIRGQLNGVIPSTNEGQKADSSALIDASSINIEAMGTFTMNDDGKGGVMGGGFHSRGNGFGENEAPKQEPSSETGENTSEGSGNKAPEEENENEIPEIPDGKNGNEIPGNPDRKSDDGIPSNSDDMPSGSDRPSGEIRQTQINNILCLGGSFLLLLTVTLLAKCYHRKMR